MGVVEQVRLYVKQQGGENMNEWMKWPFEGIRFRRQGREFVGEYAEDIPDNVDAYEYLHDQSGGWAWMKCISLPKGLKEPQLGRVWVENCREIRGGQYVSLPRSRRIIHIGDIMVRNLDPREWWKS
jgi:hypothetical protein